jgi:nucleotide-binding universal stress UspA family protein
MLNLKQILVPTDFSTPSENALLYGKALAETFGATLHLIHVVEEPPVYPWASPEGLMPMPLPAWGEIEETVRAQMGKLLTDAEQRLFRAQVVTAAGSPFVEIVRYAKSHEIDLIVIGTHGRGPVAHMLLGSVAEKVVRKAPCPVLTVRHPEHEFVMP